MAVQWSRCNCQRQRSRSPWWIHWRMSYRTIEEATAKRNYHTHRMQYRLNQCNGVGTETKWETKRVYWSQINALESQPFPTANHLGYFIGLVKRQHVHKVCDAKSGFWHAQLDVHELQLSHNLYHSIWMLWVTEYANGDKPSSWCLAAKDQPSVRWYARIVPYHQWCDDVLITGQGETQEEAVNNHLVDTDKRASMLIQINSSWNKRGSSQDLSPPLRPVQCVERLGTQGQWVDLDSTAWGGFPQIKRDDSKFPSTEIIQPRWLAEGAAWCFRCRPRHSAYANR